MAFMKLFTLLTFIFLFGCVVAPTEYTPGISDHDLDPIMRKQTKEPWYNQYLVDFIEPHNKVWPELSAKCWPEMTNAGLKGFHLVAVIDSNGRVIDTRSSKPSFSPECFSSGIKEIHYPQPPVDYAVVVITVGKVE